MFIGISNHEFIQKAQNVAKTLEKVETVRFGALDDNATRLGPFKYSLLSYFVLSLPSLKRAHLNFIVDSLTEFEECRECWEELGIVIIPVLCCNALFNLRELCFWRELRRLRIRQKVFTMDHPSIKNLDDCMPPKLECIKFDNITVTDEQFDSLKNWKKCGGEVNLDSLYLYMHDLYTKPAGYVSYW